MSLAQIYFVLHGMDYLRKNEKLMTDWLIDFFSCVLYMNCTSYFFNGFPKIVGTKPTVVGKTVVPPANDAYIQNVLV